MQVGGVLDPLFIVGGLMDSFLGIVCPGTKQEELEI